MYLLYDRGRNQLYHEDAQTPVTTAVSDNIPIYELVGNEKGRELRVPAVTRARIAKMNYFYLEVWDFDLLREAREIQQKGIDPSRDALDGVCRRAHPMIRDHVREDVAFRLSSKHYYKTKVYKWTYQGGCKWTANGTTLVDFIGELLGVERPYLMDQQGYPDRYNTSLMVYDYTESNIGSHDPEYIPPEPVQPGGETLNLPRICLDHDYSNCTDQQFANLIKGDISNFRQEAAKLSATIATREIAKHRDFAVEAKHREQRRRKKGGS